MSSTAVVISQKAQDKDKIAGWVEKIQQCNEDFAQFEHVLNQPGGNECPNFGKSTVIFSSDALKSDSEIQSIELTSVSLNTADRRQPVEFMLKINLKDMIKEVNGVSLFVDFIDTLPLIVNAIVPGIRVELSLYRKERLQPFLMRLHKKYHVPIEIIHALLSSSVFYKHYTLAEEAFYEKLRKIAAKPEVAMVSSSSPKLSSNANAVASASAAHDAKMGAETQHANNGDLQALMDEARGLDTAYLTEWLRFHTRPLGMEFDDPEELAREKEEPKKLSQRFVSISESMYSLAEVYFQQRAFFQALQILTAIGSQDLFFKYAQLMEVKIKFANCSQVQDKAGRLQRRNLMCELANIDHLGADLLLERLFEIQYGRTQKEVVTDLESDEAAIAALQKTGQETAFTAMFDIFDQKFRTGSSKFTKSMLEQMRELFPEANLIVPAGASYTPSYSASGVAGSATAAALPHLQPKLLKKKWQK